MVNIFRSFIPWILFFSFVGHTQSSIETATVIALISHVLVNRKALQHGFILDIGALCFFVFFILNLFLFKLSVITNNGYLIANAALAIITWISLLIKKPFTLQYARLEVSYEISETKLFIVINYLLTTLWSVILTLMIIPNIIELFFPTKYATDIDVGVSIFLMLIGVLITQKFPEWYANKTIEKNFNIDIKNLYKNEHQPKLNQQSHNEDKVSHKRGIDTDVVIVGAGPVGLTSALLLQSYGIKTIVIEKHPGISIHPKARGISCRSMELFRRLGCDREISSHDLPVGGDKFVWLSSLIGKTYGFLNKCNNYAKFSPTDETTASQQYVEAALLKKYKERGGDVLFQHKVIDLAQNSEISQVSIYDLKNKLMRNICSKYIVAADGAKSTIRQILNIPMVGPAEINAVYSVHCQVDLDNDLTDEQRFNIAFLIRQGKPAPMVLSVDGKKEWIFIFPSAGLSQEKLKALYTDQYIKDAICSVVGKDELAINILGKNIWSIGAQIANQLSLGRTFFVGDSAHRFPPTGGMGMNMGLQDADNLMWKIAHVLNGKANASILDTYAVERLPIILDVMQWSLDNLKRKVDIQRQYEKEGIDHVDFSMLIKQEENHFNKIGIDLGTVYQSEIISVSESNMPDVFPDQYSPVIYPGARLPHIEIYSGADKISTLDLIKDKFILLHDERNQYVSQLDFQGIDTHIVPVHPVNPTELESILGIDERAAIWVRPDGHVAWFGYLDDKNNLNDLKSLISRMKA